MSSTENAGAKPLAEISIEDFSSLIATMSRLLVGLGRIPPFSEADIGLAEWVALITLGQKDGVSNKVLGRNLGVTGQRANQISASLARGGYIVVNNSANDNRENEIKITDAGRAKIDMINSQLKPLLATALEGRERSLASVSKQMRFVARILQTANPEKPGRKTRKKEAS